MKRKELNLLLIAVTTLVVGALSPLAYSAPAKTGIPTAGPVLGIDDRNTSTITPFPIIPVSTVGAGGPNAGQCPWITSGMDAFVTANPTWSYSWATPAQEALVEPGIQILDYSAWVVSEPDKIKDAKGNVYDVDKPLQGNKNVHDVGGAIFNISYDPTKATAGAHVFSNLQWIQGVNATYDNPALNNTGLDNPFAKGTPFYNDGGAAGQLPGGGGYFLDTPWKIENEAAEAAISASVGFQVVLADYDSKQKKVTLYGGDWWGYQYVASDPLAGGGTPIGFNVEQDIETAAVPLPQSAGVGFGMLGLFGGLAVLRKKLSRKPRMA